MDPLRYRKAYEAMIHVSQLLEHRLNNDPTSEEKSEPDAAGNGVAFEIEDPDSMEWTPTATGTSTPPAGCGPPPSTAKHMRHLLPDAGEGEYQIEDQGDNTVLLYKLQEGTVMDECIDRLVRDLPDVLSYENAAAFTPSTIEVPKDFGLQLSISINHHLAQVADRKVLEKYRRLLGHRKDSTKRKSVRLGFDAVELIQNQAIKFPENAPVKESTLDNEIHPIFRLENFHGCSDAIYEELKPALRLASLFLFSRGTFTFWHTLVFGDRKQCKETSELYGQPCARIVEDVAWSEENAGAFRDFMDKQVDTVHFMFHREPLPPDPAYASMGLVADYKNGIMRKLNGKCHTSRICLHSDFYTTAKKLSLLQYPEPAMVLRFNLFLAVCLAHEMAHFIEVSGPHHDHPLGQPEVFFNDNKWTESGIAFELKVFGGRLHPISSRVDCGLGLAVLNYPLRELYEKEDNVLYTLPMDYITKLQQKETWDRDFSEADAAVFHVPRTGCRSIEINGINLMIWEDEKDVEISDDVDQLDTMFKRKDDGSIIKNPNSNNRTPKRHVEGRRWSPYGHKRKGTAEAVECVSNEVSLAVGEDQEAKANESNESEEGTAAEASNSDDDMA
ncbi:uncharacterized protein CC84DRAFT_154807 [Paraphaeosphaeria sporulosa]|uniref:Uncharacterized protein n=1 Tax=Paraphaeosphaeria sporulosa TaxID=1460663 RepID=A0A177CYP9_9PLEO|nr:uncharacterized protein CC84DRAFT_154807 [Paraphaeosphaeria sporulosa]OAG12643.1 hypothetical protein CC84DRAFT_154807 [Paraphaeosphaeria sporulosa]